MPPYAAARVAHAGAKPGEREIAFSDAAAARANPSGLDGARERLARRYWS
jgi:hypothetical protein